MSGFGGVGRREFLTGAGGATLLTLAGLQVPGNAQADMEGMGRQVAVPPAVAAARGRAPAAVTTQANGGSVREYWIQAEKTAWNIVPTHRDAVLDVPIKGRTTFKALTYRAYTPNFGKPLTPGGMPGPILEAEVGDTIVVNFRNRSGAPATMHPHGVFYSVDMDGAYKGKYTTPSGFVENGRSFQYVWQAVPGTQGAWPYHDHGPLCPLPVFKGLFGALIIREPGAVIPDREYFIMLHSFSNVETGIDQSFMCINGKAYAGNTPTLTAKVGETVAFHVFGMDDNFHTFHIHGHRWVDPDGGQIVDNKEVGPAESLSLQFVEDNPGRWMYHCHVFTHMMMGMIGWYVVTE
jgi:FtsP/CotA-like multicopper oxidase with cupredoxin domain